MALLYRMGSGNGSGGDLKPFIVNFTCDSGFIGKTVTMEYLGTPHAGETVDNVSGTVANDGTLTLYPMHDGLWKYYATSDVSGYQERTKTLEKWGNYPVELNDTPDGATVTPTDDVQTWLHCANVWDKTNLTTIDDVIADTTTLNTLISDNNASDYLARSTTFATDICNNESAMTYIGLNDYCANKLLADSTWLTAICSVDETLFKKVLNVFVPRMTSNTTPSGEASGSSFKNDNYPYWHAFTNGDTDGWIPDGLNGWIQYDFKKPVVAKLFRQISLNSNRPSTATIQGYNGTTWEDIETNISIESTQTLYKPLNNNKPYSIYRVSVVATSSAPPWLGALNFYGREEA